MLSKCTFTCSLELLLKLEQVYISDILTLFIILDVLYKTTVFIFKIQIEYQKIDYQKRIIRKKNDNKNKKKRRMNWYKVCFTLTSAGHHWFSFPIWRSVFSVTPQVKATVSEGESATPQMKSPCDSFLSVPCGVPTRLRWRTDTQKPTRFFPLVSHRPVMRAVMRHSWHVRSRTRSADRSSCWTPEQTLQMFPDVIQQPELLQARRTTKARVSLSFHAHMNLIFVSENRPVDSSELELYLWHS